LGPLSAAPPPASGADAQVFDRAGMLVRLMGDEDLARTVVAGFLEDIPKQIEQLRGYLGAGDATGATRQSHTIKGASANIGGEALRAVALQMETSARAGDLEAAGSNLPDLETQFALLKEALSSFIAEKQPDPQP
jgi:HPt (histidine-containing phosphotransfer) domain-containing protein